MKRAIGVLILLVMVSSPVCAEIYRYVDRDGVMHFTSVPNLPGYKRVPGLTKPKTKKTKTGTSDIYPE